MVRFASEQSPMEREAPCVGLGPGKPPPFGAQAHAAHGVAQLFMELLLEMLLMDDGELLLIDDGELLLMELLMMELLLMELLHGELRC